jgi:hypothetical protein
VFAVNCPPQEPADGQATQFEFVQVLVAHAADAVGADTLEHVDNRHIPAAVASRKYRAPVQEHGWHVEPDHRHHDAWQRLVAAGNADHGVVAMTAHREFDGIRDHLPRNKG